MPVLPTARQVAEFYARALVSVPGVSASRVCLSAASAQEGAMSQASCGDCAELRASCGESLPGSFGCQLDGEQGVLVVPLDTASARHGFFVLGLGDGGAFEPYRAFVHNLGNFLALSLENRLHGEGLQRAHAALERRVEERTEELRRANRALEVEVEQRKEAEAAVRELNQELERRVRDRTDQLEAANRELEAFAYSVSHDLRAPLRHVGGFLELLVKRTAGALDPESQRYVDAAAQASARMGQLIDDLLAFSRMGRQELSWGRVDLTELAREVARELEPEAGGRTVRWRIGELPAARGDRSMLRLVLVNLLLNALKFTRPRAVAEIEIGCAPGGDGEVVVFVRDNGVGFDMAYAANLFGVFKRLHRANEFEGTGIGLANVRRIVHRHGGRTWARAAVDQGATFYFALPRALPEQAVGTPTAATGG